MPDRTDLSETTQLDYGAVVEPTSGSVTWTVDTNDVASGTATQFSGPTFSGEYVVTKGPGPNNPIDIDVTASGSPPPGITIGSFTATYQGSPITLPAFDLNPPTGQGSVLRVGATLTITSAVTPGTKLPGFAISIVK